MAIKAEYQNYVKSVLVKKLESQSVIEIRFPDNGYVAAVSPQVYLTSLEVSSGRVNYGGRIVLSVAYVGDDGTLIRQQKGAEFSHYIDDATLVPANIGQCQLRVKKTTLRREGTSCIVSVIVSSDIAIYSKSECKYITALENAFYKSDRIDVYANIPFSGESEIEDQFDCVAGDILITKSKAIVISAAARGGYVEIEGEIYLNILAVRDNLPIGLDRTIPFKVEVGVEESDSAAAAIAFAEVKELSIDAKVVEDKGTCDAIINATVSVFGCLVKSEKIDVVTDAFSASNRLEVERVCESFLFEPDSKVYTERVSALCSTKSKIDYTCAFRSCSLADCDFSPTETGIAGAIVATLIYEQGGELMSTEISLPFEMNLSGTNALASQISVAVSGVSVRQKEEGECECQATIKVCCQSLKSEERGYVVEVTEGEPIAEEGAAISVCVPKKGATLFDIGKQLCLDPDEVAKTNPDLTFPLSGSERVIIYRAKNG